ncbi:MAG TPA: crosslink repair DNA glycosylase YcaQ family protein [Candidatus Angelobacter sp.]|nr:crosslink repair DNA glycosylase YcaQ family protein [Candidatus Angelobacter sp.]
MTEQELHHQRAELWRVNGNAIHTIEDAKGFLDSVGFCLMYPVRSLPMVPSFLAAFAGSSVDLPDAKHAFADPRKQPATELMVRLLRERQAYEINLLPESSLVVSAPLFPFLYALVGDRNPKATPKTKAQGARLSPLALKVFESIQKRGPLSKKQLQELISRELTGAALDRALNELWSILKITRVDYSEKEGASWDLLYRWSPAAVMEGSRVSAPEAISALLGKYLEAVVAATQEDIEQFFSHLSTRSKVREAVHALLAGRELDFITVGAKTLIHLAPVPEPHQRRIHG